MIQPIVVGKPSLQVVGHEAPFIHALSPDANNLDVIDKLCTGLAGELGLPAQRDRRH